MKPAESAAKSRTRAAILDAAIQLLATDANATLADIATAAGVGRSTLHRYYTDRTALLHDVAREITTRAHQSIQQAQEQGHDFRTVLERATDSLLALGPVMIFVTNEPAIACDKKLTTELWMVDQAVTTALFTQAHTELKPPMTPQWAANFYWSLLYSGYEAMESGYAKRSEAIEMIMAALTNGIVHAPRQK